MTTLRLVLIFAVALSLVAIPGPLSRNLPAVPLVKANPAPAVAPWYPAGPALDTLRVSIFAGPSPLIQAILQLPPAIDFEDTPLTPPQISTICPSPAFFCTSPVADHGYFELEFNLANTFWGINMNFGNDAKGALLRQGIAHLVNKDTFVAKQTDIATQSAAIDNPVPAGAGFGGTILTTPNSCGWDLNFTEISPNCLAGFTGGIAYNCNIGAVCPTGTIVSSTVFPWQPAVGSPDFCAAATHFKDALNRVIPGGVVTLNANCVLLPPGSTTPDVHDTVWHNVVPGWTPVNVFARIDHNPRLQLGQSIAQELCALFTGALTTTCGDPLSLGAPPSIVSETEGTISQFPGFPKPPNQPCLCWWIYTAGFPEVFPFDQSLYFTYNSRFAGLPTGSPCASTKSSSIASDYMFLCSSAYDSASNQMEFASNLPSAFTAATNALNIFGQNAYTIPIWTGLIEFAYLSNWQRAVNADGAGTPNFFTWLDAWSPNPASLTETPPSLTIRQGFSESTRSLNPYVAITKHDFFVLRNIYDSLFIGNPANNGQLIEWMTADPSGPVEFPCSGSVCPGLGYTPPAGTLDNFRFTLRGDLFWQDASSHPLTGFVSAWDVKFTYATMLANGAFQAAGISSMICSLPGCVDGITVKGPRQFDVHLNATGPFILPGLGSLTILPGRLWSTCTPAAWDSGVATGSVPDNCMSTDPNKLLFSFDPLSGGILLGSGAYECLDTFGGTFALGKGCSSTGLQNPPSGGTYTLTRFGFGTGAPGTAPSNRIYFRSSSNAAKWIWTNDNGGVKDVGNLVAVLACLNAPVAALGPIPDPNLGFPNGCAHWQQGIGNGGGTTGHPLGPAQIVIVLMYLGVRWVAPFDWTGTFGTVPMSIALFPPVFYEGSYVSGGANIRPTLNPASIAECLNTFDPASPTSGGYNC